MEIIPKEIQWNVFKYLRHPVAELFLNEGFVSQTKEWLTEVQEDNNWSSDSEMESITAGWFVEYVFGWIADEKKIDKKKRISEDENDPRNPNYYCSCHDCDWCEQTQGGRYPYLQDSELD